jgi:hypothetical protein
MKKGVGTGIVQGGDPCPGPRTAATVVPVGSPKKFVVQAPSMTEQIGNGTLNFEKWGERKKLPEGNGSSLEG